MKLTARQREILEGLRKAQNDLTLTDEYDLVESDGEVWFGLTRTNMSTLLFLLRRCLVSSDDYDTMSYKQYDINGWGCRALDDPDFDPEYELFRLQANAERAQETWEGERELDKICAEAARVILDDGT
jgi:hypothetical protein